MRVTILALMVRLSDTVLIEVSKTAQVSGTMAIQGSKMNQISETNVNQISNTNQVLEITGIQISKTNVTPETMHLMTRRSHNLAVRKWLLICWQLEHADFLEM